MYRTRQAVENETTTQKTLRVQHGNSKVLLTAKIIVKKKTLRATKFPRMGIRFQITFLIIKYNYVGQFRLHIYAWKIVLGAILIALCAKLKIKNTFFESKTVSVYFFPLPIVVVRLKQCISTFLTLRTTYRTFDKSQTILIF